MQCQAGVVGVLQSVLQLDFYSQTSARATDHIGLLSAERSYIQTFIQLLHNYYTTLIQQLQTLIHEYNRNA